MIRAPSAASVSHLMQVRQMRRFYALQRSDFWLGMLALLGVITIDVLPGLLIAVGASLLLFVYRASRPHVAVLGKVPETADAYTDLQRHPANQVLPGLVIVRLDAPLFFANAAVVREERSQLHHAIDVLPTILEVTGIAEPAMADGVPQKPIEGVSMAYSFAKEQAGVPSRHYTQSFEMFG
jgi:MFS superfamily sulfate permease-like transporter